MESGALQILELEGLLTARQRARHDGRFGPRRVASGLPAFRRTAERAGDGRKGRGTRSRARRSIAARASMHGRNNTLRFVDPTRRWNQDSRWWNPLTWFNKPESQDEITWGVRAESYDENKGNLAERVHQ